MCFFGQNIFITPYEALVYQMLDTGLSILDIKRNALYLIQYRASRIKYLALYGSNVIANYIFIFDSGSSGLGNTITRFGGRSQIAVGLRNNLFSNRILTLNP